MNEPSINPPDETGLGPETDLILSLLAIVLVVGVLVWGSLAKQRRDVMQQLEHANAQVASLTKEVTELREELRNRQEIFSLTERGNFSSGLADLILSGDEQKSLQENLQKARRDLLEGKFDRIEVQGNASPEGPLDKVQRSTPLRCVADLANSGLNFNSRLAYCRAVSTALTLNELKIPMDCLVIAGAGRSDSRLLNSYYLKSTPEAADAQINSRSNTRDDPQLKEERRVTISLIRSPKDRRNNICSVQLRNQSD